MSDDALWVRRRGTTSREGWEVVVDDTLPGWSCTSLRVVTLPEGGARTVHAEEWEHLVVPLSGSVAVVAVSAQPTEGVVGEAVLAGRPSVFAGPTDVAYAARDVAVTVTAHGGPARVAVCGARAAARHEPVFRHLPATDVPVELRGAGQASRQVHDLCLPGVVGADSLLVCEVLTPGGNWSSWPPHKHDEDVPGVETRLEEVYYFELRHEAGTESATDADPFGYQRVRGAGEQPLDVLAEVRTGDVVLVPHGWHGPSTAPAGYDLYYLNVMAGPGTERAWLIRDDPAHAWVRDTWPTQQVDPRLPFGGADGA